MEPGYGEGQALLTAKAVRVAVPQGRCSARCPGPSCAETDRGLKPETRDKADLRQNLLLWTASPQCMKICAREDHEVESLREDLSQRGLLRRALKVNIAQGRVCDDHKTASVRVDVAEDKLKITVLLKHSDCLVGSQQGSNSRRRLTLQRGHAESQVETKLCHKPLETPQQGPQLPMFKG